MPDRQKRQDTEQEKREENDCEKDDIAYERYHDNHEERNNPRQYVI